MINAFHHSATAATIQFPISALRESSEARALQQVTGHNSDGSFYCYSRSGVRHGDFSLIYTQVSDATRDALETFIQARNGDKHPFTWYDENGTGSSVRFSSGRLVSTPTGPGRWRVQISISLHSDPVLITGTETDWDTVAARTTGITPIWIMRSAFNDITRDFSDSAWQFPAASLNSFDITLPLVSQWGEVRESISGSLGEMLVSDFSITLMVDQDEGENIRHLALSHPLETNPVELYLTYAELDPTVVAPRLKFKGYVKDIDLPDETQVQMTIEDESNRLQQYLGRRISSEVYPLSDPDAIGHMIPIVYGTVPKLPALCVDAGWVSSLISDITPATTVFTASGVPGYPLVNKVITIDDEAMLVIEYQSVVTGFNVAAGVNGATASASDTYSPTYQAANAINGDRSGSGWDTGTGGWNSALSTPGLPSVLDISFPVPCLIDEVSVFSVQDNYRAPQTPTASMTGSLYHLIDFKVQTWDGSGWVDRATVINNWLIWKKVSFPAVTTSKIRIFCTRAPDSYYRIAEVEAYNTAGTVTATAGRQLVVQRGYAGSVAAVHTKGTAIIEKKSTPLVYLCADHPLDAIGQIYARVKNIDVDITSDCTKYLGRNGNELAAYPGLACVTIPDIVSVSNRISLAIADNIAVNDSLHTHVAAPTINPPVSLEQSVSGSTTQTASYTIPTGTRGTGQWVYYYGNVYWSFATPPGTILSSTINITITCPAGSYIYFAGILIASNTPAYTNQVLTFTFSPATQATAMNLSGSIIRVQVYLGARWLALGQLTTYPETLNSGNVTVSPGKRSITYNAGTSTIALTQSPSGVQKTGTVTLTGNSVSDVAIAEMLLVDCDRSSISAPFAVLNDLLVTYCNDTSLVQIGTLPASYRLNGAIREYKKALEWLDALSFQCRSFFRKLGGEARMIVREVNPAVTGSIPACSLTDEGIKALAYKKAPLSDVINQVNVLYNRDWSIEGRKAEAYNRSVVNSDAASIASYGPQERPDLFMFDFVTEPSMAAELGGFYADFYGDRKWRITFSTFLDHAGFRFGDILQLGFANDLVGICVEAGIAPGDSNAIDRMNFIVEAAVIPVLDEFALTTLLGDQLVSKEKEGIVYV